mmetsp:Transcript_11206/g.21097  ORF Transcript_11206/g.21097 Transcript_11206/m.21097 type:complete len:153 (+) Transcript_11206:1475-1933(+)
MLRVYIDSRTVPKYCCPTLVPSVSWEKAIANTYVKKSNKQRVKKTDRHAANMPLMSIISSGMDRNRRAMRAMRDRRKSRAIRMMEAFPNPSPFPPLIRIMAVMTQVSSTIIKTKAESNINHLSFTRSRFLRSAPSFTANSRKKYAQNMCSAV